MNSGPAQQAEAQRFRKQSKKIGRKLSRRLSLITKVPNIFNVKFTGTGAEGHAHGPQKMAAAFADETSAAQAHEITVIAPDKTQRLVSFYVFVLLINFLSKFVFAFPSYMYGPYNIRERIILLESYLYRGKLYLSVRCKYVISYNIIS